MIKKLINYYKTHFGTAFNSEMTFGEDLYADEYRNQKVRDLIAKEYKKLYPEPVETPISHPWKYDPLTPPSGWRYDPQYGIWENVKEK